MVSRSVVGLCCVCASLASVACSRSHLVAPAPDAASDVVEAGAPPGEDRASEGDAASAQPPAPVNLAHNIILFLGDGMGPEQLATGRFAAGGRLRLDVLAGPALSNTDSLTSLRLAAYNPPPTDSAAGATAIATGVLVENGVLSRAASGEPLETVLEACKRAGKATGLVTTALFFDASPAAFSSHQPARGLYPEIVREMLSVTQPDVIMGAGRSWFDAPDGRWGPLAEQAGYTVLRSAVELADWDPIVQPRLLGLFETDFVPLVPGAERFTMTPELERTESSPDPALATMTERALERLSRDEDGFFLFAEDELFDEMGHRGTPDLKWANRAYPRQAAGFDAAVAVAIDWVLAHSSFDETLIVVLADHETGGYHFDHTLGPSSGTFSASGVHTRIPIEVYALGPGSSAILAVKSHTDAHRLLLGSFR